MNNALWNVKKCTSFTERKSTNFSLRTFSGLLSEKCGNRSSSFVWISLSNFQAFQKKCSRMDTACEVHLHLAYFDKKGEKKNLICHYGVNFTQAWNPMPIADNVHIHYPAWILIYMETRYSATTHFSRSNNISILKVVHITLLSCCLHSVKSISEADQTPCRWAWAVTRDGVLEEHIKLWI